MKEHDRVEQCLDIFGWAGAYVRSVTGELWGRVVLDQGRSWQLASGRSAKKENLGQSTLGVWQSSGVMHLAKQCEGMRSFRQFKLLAVLKLCLMKLDMEGCKACLDL